MVILVGLCNALIMTGASIATVDQFETLSEIIIYNQQLQTPCTFCKGSHMIHLIWFYEGPLRSGQVLLFMASHTLIQLNLSIIGLLSFFTPLKRHISLDNEALIILTLVSTSRGSQTLYNHVAFTNLLSVARRMFSCCLGVEYRDGRHWQGSWLCSLIMVSGRRFFWLGVHLSLSLTVLLIPIL